MKAEIVSSSVVRVTGIAKRASLRKRMQQYKAGSALYKIPPSRVDLLDGLVPPALLTLAQRPGQAFESQPIHVPAAMWQALYPYQREGVRRVIYQFKGRCLLADEMGLGKTRQALAVVAHYAVKTLVICPSFLQANWRHELASFGLTATVCSFGTVPTQEKHELIVVDEAHYLKTRDSCRVQVVLPLLLAAPRVLLLSGTPCPNRPEELYVLMHALRPRIVPSFTAFAKRYCNPRRTAFNGFDTRGHDRKAELKWLLGRAFWIRRTKAMELKGMPLKTSRKLMVESSLDMRSKICELRQRMEQALAKGSKLAQTLMSEMYRATALAKVEQATQLVASMIQAGEPVVVFAHHQIVLDAMQEALTPALRVGRIDGKTPLTARHQVVTALQGGELDVAVLSMAAAGVGLTLTRARKAFFLEIPWCPAVLRQCEDRIHRIGQTANCTIYYVLAHETLDTYVWNTIHRKERVAARIGQLTGEQAADV